MVGKKSENKKKLKRKPEKKLASEFRAILATDLGKIFSCVMVFLLIFLIIPLIYPLMTPLQEMLMSIFGGAKDLGTFFMTFILFIVLLIFLIAFFGFAVGLVMLKLAFWINKKIAPPLKRSNTQHYTKYIAIIVGVIIGFLLIGIIFNALSGINGVLLGSDFLITMFTVAVLVDIGFLTVFLGAIYLCIFLNDLLFYIYRKAANKPLIYTPPEARVITRRHKAGLSILIIIMIMAVLVMGIYLNLTKPTGIHVVQRSAQITVVGAAKDQIRVVNFNMMVGSLTPTELKGLVEGGIPPESDTILAALVHPIPPPLLDSRGWLDGYSFDYSFTLPRGQNIMGFQLYVYVDLPTGSGFFEAYYYPEDAFQCGTWSKNVALSAVTVLFNGLGVITGITFEVTLDEQFYWSDLLNFGW